MKNQLIKPLEYTEHHIINDILEGIYPPGANLPSEREYAEILGVTRPTLREALGRIERDGWITIQHGKSTVVNDYWKEGGLNILSTLTKFGGETDWMLALHVLKIRIDIAPEYTYQAVLNNPEDVIEILKNSENLYNDPKEFSEYDWELHHRLTVLSENLIYPLILNGFKSLYHRLAVEYYALEEARELSRFFYQRLLMATKNGDPAQAKQITLSVMKESFNILEAQNMS